MNHSFFNHAAGAVLKKLCKEKGISSHELADSLRTSQSTISRIMRGKKPLTLSMFIDICDVLNIERHIFIRKVFAYKMKVSMT